MTPWAVIACVPLINAKPSLAWRFKGCLFNSLNTSSLSFSSPLYNTFPSPINANAKCDNGAKSPDAPREPCCGIIGIIRSFIKNCNCLTNSKVAPEWPFNNVFNRKIIMTNATSFENGSPSPQACERIRFTCNSLYCVGSIRTSLNNPKPVVIP